MSNLRIFSCSGCAIGPVKLTVSIEDLFSSAADAIVVPVGANFDMTGL